MRTKRWPIAEQAACRLAALRAMATCPAFALFAVPVVAFAGASAAAVHAFVATVEFAAVVCAEFPVACGHRRRVVVASAAPADAFARRAAAPGLAAAGADQAVAGVSARAQDSWEPRSVVSAKEGGLGWCARYSPTDSLDDSFLSGFREGDPQR